jgi:hypothetical protein
MCTELEAENMRFANANTPIVICIILAFGASAARAQHARKQGEATVFPVLMSWRVLILSGGLFLAVLAAHEIFTAGVTALGLFLSFLSVLPILLPLQSAVISKTGVGSLPVLFAKGVMIPWNCVRKVERKKGGRLIIIVGEEGIVTYTRYNADPEVFERMLKQHIDPSRWSPLQGHERRPPSGT